MIFALTRPVIHSLVQEQQMRQKKFGKAQQNTH